MTTNLHAVPAPFRRFGSNAIGYGLREDRPAQADFTFDEVPRLETKRLILREIRTSDAQPLFRICSDAEWMAFWGLPIHRTIDDTRKMIEDIRRRCAERSALRWAITVKDNDRTIGSLGFSRFMPQHYRAEITGEIDRSESRKGYATEAGRAVVQFGFETLGLHSIEANIDPDNAASRAVIVGIGFQREGYLRQNYFLDGRFYDTVVYSMLSGRPPHRLPVA